MLQAKKLCRLQWHFPKGKYAVYLKITFFNKKYTTFFTMHFLKGNLLYYSALNNIVQFVTFDVLFQKLVLKVRK